jgi:mono/diheme cytochrome c family protein
MRFTSAVVVTVGLAIGAYSAASAQTKTQWDGVYTAEQAKRGESSYVEHCSSCHGRELNGGEMAPGLAGGEFSANWNELNLGQLFERMKTSMPQNNPNSLSRQVNADILAFMLAKGGFPAGQAELPTEAEKLTAIQFAAQNPNAK